jgi:glyoxylase-like metal-dependent hydrolase (beta-lactamase superfamily II)
MAAANRIGSFNGLIGSVDEVPDWSNGPSNMSEAVQQQLPERTVVALVNTHAHFDHSGHIPDLLEHYPVKWYLHGDDTYLQTLAQSSARRWGFDAPEPAVADEGLVPLTTMSFGALDFEVLHTPGHTLGGCCLNLLVDNGANHLFVGDTLFAGSVGRTDLPDTGGDFEVLAASIHTQLWPLEGNTIVYPGHGPLTTIGHERRTNPFVGEGAGAGGTFGRGKYA